MFNSAWEQGFLKSFLQSCGLSSLWNRRPPQEAHRHQAPPSFSRRAFGHGALFLSAARTAYCVRPMPPECIGATIYSVFNSFRGGFTILIRLMAFVFVAAALLALPCGAHACPDHAAVVQAVSASWQGEPASVGSHASRHEAAVRAECSAAAPEAPCTDRLCCVTPPAAPAPECRTAYSASVLPPATGSRPADTSVILGRDSPPPKA